VEKKKNCFEMYHPNKDQVKAVKMSSGQTTKGHHDSYLICAANEQEMEDWVSAIENSSFTNPYQQLLEERKRKQQQLASQTTANGKGAKDKKEEKKAGGNKRAKKAPDVKIDFDELCDMANMCSVAVKTASGIKELCGSGAIVDPPINDVNYFIVIQHRLKKQRVVISGTKWDTSSKLKAFMGKDLGAEHAELQRTAEAIKKRCLTCLKKEFGTDICGNSVGSPVALFVSLLLQLEGFKISKVVTYGQPKFIRPDSLNEYIGLPVLRVIEHDDPVCSLFSGFVHYGNKVLLLNDSNYCSLKDSDQDHEVKIAGPEDLNDQRLAHHHITYYLRLLKPKVGVKVIEVSYDDRKKYLG
jgi:triacylglycerol lipase